MKEGPLRQRSFLFEGEVGLGAQSQGRMVVDRLARDRRGVSGLHGVDARSRIVLLLVYSIALLAVPWWPLTVILILLPFALLPISRVGAGVFLRSLVPVIILAVFTFLCFLPSHWNLQGGFEGLLIALRMIALVAASYILCLTTTSTDLLRAFRWFISPLGRLGARRLDDLSFTLSLSLRFFPLIAQEFDQVRKAQISRGGSAQGKGLVRTLQLWGSAFSAVFIGLFRRADTIAVAMDARCYGLKEQR